MEALYKARWKINEKLFDIPAFILDAIRAITGGNDNLFNAGDLFLGEGGARTTNNANEIAPLRVRSGAGFGRCGWMQ